MKWKQQFGPIRLAQANNQHSSLSQICLVCEEAQHQLDRRNFRHMQCHNIANQEIMLAAESTKYTGKF